MICTTNCVASFFTIHNTIIIVLSILISVLAYYLSVNSNLLKSKITFSYVNIAAFLFPIIYFLMYRGCQNLFNGCDQGLKFVYLIAITLAISTLIVAIALPFLFLKNKIKKSIKTNIFNPILKKFFTKLPKTFIIDDSKPYAFSTKLSKPKIFISQGILEILNKKEQNAILLHEIAHLKSKSFNSKLILNLSNIITPFSHFSTINKIISKEELDADRFAINIQKTGKHLINAKNKINSYYEQSYK